MKTRRVEISPKTIVFIVFFLIGLAVLWNIRSIIMLFFVCFIFMEAINPVVRKMESFKVPRVLAITIIYLFLLAVLFFAFAGIIPVLIEQTSGIVKSLPEIIQHTSVFGFSAVDFSSQLKILEPLPGNIANIAVSILSNIFSAIVILMITFYLLLERKKFGRHCINYFGENIGSKLTMIIDNLEIRLGSWVNAELILMITIGALSYIAYLILGLDYALSLAIIAGLLEIVPNIGPIISVMIASIVGLTISPTTALLTVIAGVVIQQLENNIIVPKIMKEACDISPIITILLLLIGAKLGGVVGAILAVPIFMTIEVVVKVVMGKDLRLSADIKK